MYLVHLAREKILKLWSNENVLFLSGGECDTPDLALKSIDKLLIKQGASSFHRSQFAKNFIIKRA